jgi:hypothetical protein
VPSRFILRASSGHTGDVLATILRVLSDCFSCAPAIGAISATQSRAPVEVATRGFNHRRSTLQPTCNGQAKEYHEGRSLLV